jgi:hypothetical protein
MGIKEEYAAELAATFVPDKYLTKYNVGRYLRRLNTTLVRIQNRAMTRSEYEDEDGQREYFNDAGINLADDEVIMSIYEKFFEEVDRDVYLAGLTSVLLENRGKFVDNYSKPQREMYNAVSRVVMDLLEGHAVLNITGKKMKDKKLAKEVVSKKELKKVMKNYSKRRADDFRKGNDTPRRITIMNYDVDTYPKIMRTIRAPFWELILLASHPRNLAAWGERAQVAVTITIRPIWNASVNWLLSPFHHASRSSRGPLPISSERTNTTIIRITQNTKDSGMIFSAAKLNFLLHLHRSEPLSTF